MFFFSSRRRHTRCALVTGVQTCALPIYRIADVAKGGAVQCTAERWTVERTGSGTSDPVIQVDDPFGGGALFRSLGADAGFVVSADTMVRGEIGMIGYLLIMLSSRSTEVDVVPAPDRQIGRAHV